jgi:hypothetical protein
MSLIAEFCIQACIVGKITSDKLTAWSAVLENLIISQLVKEFPPFYGLHKDSLLYSQEPATAPYPESDESSPHIPILFL